MKVIEERIELMLKCEGINVEELLKEPEKMRDELLILGYSLEIQRDKGFSGETYILNKNDKPISKFSVKNELIENGFNSTITPIEFIK